MSPAGPSGLVHSIQARLQNEARSRKRPFVELLELFAIERLLHRLGRSKHRERFVLKGALLLRHWLGANTRPTRDIDLLGPTDIDADRLRSFLREVVTLEVEEDGIVFRPGTIVVAPIRAESPVLGFRARFDATLGRTRLRYQVDVGLGDVVFPAAEEVVPGDLPGFPMASVRAYTPYTTIAEKLEAIIVLGEANTRIKDFYDLALLARSRAFDGPTLAESIRRTFARRSTLIPRDRPEGVGDAFARAPLNAVRWDRFLSKGSLFEAEKPRFEQVVAEIRRFVGPPLAAVREATPFAAQWPPGGPWR